MILQQPFAISNKKVYYRSLTIDHTQVASTLSNFPVLVNFTDATFKTVANGGHVNSTNAFTFSSDSAGASPLKWEVERYDATTGEIVAWVKIVSVSSSSDTVFYIRYGGSITTDQSDPTNVWSNSFLGVYHLSDGTTLSVNSSTGSNNGTNHSATAAAGQIDGCGAFASASSQYIDLGTGIHPTSLTISAWAKATSFPVTDNTILSQKLDANNQWGLWIKSTGKLNCFIDVASSIVQYNGTGTNTLSTGTWYYVGMTWDQTLTTAALKGFVNGAQDGSANAAVAGGLNNNAATALIANYQTSDYWNGSLDEVRAASAARSADWLLAEYNNQKSSQTFVALGSET